MFYTGILVIIYILYVRPYKEQALNYLEIFNEVCILAIVYCMLLLTDFLPDPEIQYDIGYGIIALTGFNILGNNILIGIKTFRKVKASWRKFKFKAKMCF